MKTSEIKNQLKKIAQDFGLKYNSNWFNVLWISKRHEILTEYVGICPDPIYQKYGKTAEQRIKNIDKFVNSADFKECVKRYGGQVVTRRGLEIIEKNYKKIKNLKLKKELLKLNKKIKDNLGKNKCLALLTRSKIKSEEEKIKTIILRHEWIHILIDENNLGFEELGKNIYWKYNEGLVTYFENYLDKTLKKLEMKLDRERYPMEKYYYLYGLKFRELMKNKKTPKERKEVILKLNKK